MIILFCMLFCFSQVSVLNAGQPQFIYSTYLGLRTYLAVTPDTFNLDPPHPNPFNPETTISFTLPDAGQVRLAIYDISGQKVRELAVGQVSAGRHEFVWDGRGLGGNPVGSGIYFARLTKGDSMAVQRMVLV